LISFDPEYAASIGYPVRGLSIALTTLMVIAIVIGLQTVGVILMSAMLVAPAAAARQWTDRLSVMTPFFGAISGVIGALFSAVNAGLSTGPVIVLVISLITMLSMLFAPNRGLLWRWLARLRNQRRLRLDLVLDDLYSLSNQHADPFYGHDIATLQTMNSFEGGVQITLQELAAQNLAAEVKPGKWAITAEGLEEAALRRSERWFEEQSGQSENAYVHPAVAQKFNEEGATL